MDAGDFTGGAARLRDVLRATPTDTALRHELANVLLAAHRPAEARAQYDTLIARAPTSEFFVERARLRLDAGDQTGAEYDLLASLGARSGAPGVRHTGQHVS